MRSHMKIHYQKIFYDRNLSSARSISKRPPSALSGGTATRLTSAMQTSIPTSSNQRIGTAIGFADNVSRTIQL